MLDVPEAAVVLRYFLPSEERAADINRVRRQATCRAFSRSGVSQSEEASKKGASTP